MTPFPIDSAVDPGARGRLDTARAWSRLVGFSGTTALHMSRLLVAEALGRHTPEMGASTTQAWSKHNLKICGVECHVTGSPPTGGGIVVANHRSYLDIGVLAAQCPCVFLAKQEIARWPVLGKAARLVGTVFVERGNRASGAEAVRSLAELVQRHLTVIVFPEGTTSLGPGLLPFHGGVFRQAARADIPVVPAAITYENPCSAWVGAKRSFVDHFLDRIGRPRTTVRLTFGPPIRNSSAASLRNASRDWIADQLFRDNPAA